MSKKSDVMSIANRVLGMTFPISVVGLVIILGLTVFGVISGVRNNPETFGLLKGPEILAREEAEFVSKVGQKIELPEEKPTVATITELDKLAGNAFFRNAKEGDRVLIYQEAKKVILYRPDEDRVVEVGSLNTESGAVQGQSETVETGLVVGLLNGSGDEDVVGGVEESLASVADLSIGSSVEAANVYEQTVVVNVAGNDDEVNKVAEALGVEVVELPEGETVPEGVKVVVIIGTDRVDNNDEEV